MLTRNDRIEPPEVSIAHLGHYDTVRDIAPGSGTDALAGCVRIEGCCPPLSQLFYFLARRDAEPPEGI